MERIHAVLPILFAEPGDCFYHRPYDGLSPFYDTFEFQGRTKCGWFVFEYLGDHPKGLDINGGARDAFGGYPIVDYEVDSNPNRIRLPPHKCSGFRRFENGYQVDWDDEIPPLRHTFVNMGIISTP